MITREFNYSADKFNAEQSVQMATLEWNTMGDDGYYHRHVLRMEHHSGDGFKAAKREALTIMSKDYPNASLKVRDFYRTGRCYASFLVDAAE